MQLPRTIRDSIKARASRLLADHRKRAKQDGATLDYDLPMLVDLIQRVARCYYCLAPLSFEISLDHMQPIARGGRHAWDNLAPCCQRCNSLKGLLTEREFHDLLTQLALWHPAARQDVERRLLAGGRRYAKR